MKLAGARVVVTRAAHQAKELEAALEARGATPVLVPTIRIVDAPDGGRAVATVVEFAGDYDWIVFTSVNTVERVAGLLPKPLAARVAAIGPGTASALDRFGVEVALVPPSFVAESLVESFPDGQGRVLLPRAEVARKALPVGLEAKGWQVDVVTAYRTVPVEVGSRERALVDSADAITFTASSTVANYADSFGTHTPPVVACIGPITARTASEAGIDVSITAEEHTIEGLVTALANFER